MAFHVREATMLEMDERLVADFGCVDPIYVDGVAGILNLGQNFGMLFYRMVPVCSEGGGIALQQAPAVYLVRPKASVTLCPVLKGCAFKASMEAQEVPFGLMGGH